MATAQTFTDYLTVGNTDRYGITVPLEDGETLSAVTVTADSGLSVADLTPGVDWLSTGEISAVFTGLTVGLHNVHFEFDTTLKSDCQRMRIRVVSC